MAAPMIQIDRLLGEFAGGRWVLRNFNGTIERRRNQQLLRKERRRAPVVLK